ncbi:MAG: hypothetical protein WDN26_05570 [Chitinophagaceae bacterium]
MLNSEQNVEECDATGDDSPRDAAHSTTAGIIKNYKIKCGPVSGTALTICLLVLSFEYG